MVDRVNPTSQFHPYQPADAIPQKGNTSMSGGLGGILGKFGIDRSKIGALGGNLSGGLGSVRGMARKNPGMMLGGLAALAIGAGLLRRRGMSGMR